MNALSSAEASYWVPNPWRLQEQTKCPLQLITPIPTQNAEINIRICFVCLGVLSAPACLHLNRCVFKVQEDDIECILHLSRIWINRLRLHAVIAVLASAKAIISVTAIAHKVQLTLHILHHFGRTIELLSTLGNVFEVYDMYMFCWHKGFVTQHIRWSSLSLAYLVDKDLVTR